MRILTALVVGLGVLIVAASGLLAYGIFTRTKAPEPAAASGVGAFGSMVLDLPEGCAIKSVAVSGGNLIIHAQGTSGPDAPAACDRVVVVDSATGRIRGTVESRNPRP